jgi:hypothetical protein
LRGATTPEALLAEPALLFGALSVLAPDRPADPSAAAMRDWRTYWRMMGAVRAVTSVLERQGSGGPSGLQNRQALAAPGLEGSIPSPLRGPVLQECDAAWPLWARAGDGTPEGHLVRFDEDGELVGVTLVNARWLIDRNGKLAVTLPGEGTTELDAKALAPGPGIGPSVAGWRPPFLIRAHGRSRIGGPAGWPWRAEVMDHAEHACVIHRDQRGFDVLCARLAAG